MAVHAEHTVTVGRPIAEVFAFLADGGNNPRWRPEVSDVRLISGPGTAAAAGACYAQTMTGPGGRTIPGDYRLTVCEAPHRLEFEVIAGPGPDRLVRAARARPGGDRGHFRPRSGPAAALLPLAGTVRKLAQAEVGNLDNLQTAIDN
ncbi:hypothetical protein GXW82_19725 [Streptacidiphilus sp. 4-A2]|nr:hypothetical protein [Streptacidiphilus sp. 4-A2]